MTIKQLKKASEETSTAEWNVKHFPSFDEFMDWLDIPSPLSAYEVAAQKFEEAGYPTRAKLVRRKYEQLLKEDTCKKY